MFLVPDSWGSPLQEHNTCHAADGRFCSTPGGPSSPAFKAWFGDSKVVNPDGSPKVVYHGTVRDFDSFDPSTANPESDWGAGLYFTDTREDVDANYASIAGPDLERKIERRAEQLAQELGKEYNDPDVVAQAKAEMASHGGATLPVYLSLQNPVIVGGEGETFLDLTFPEDENGDLGDYTGALATFMDALRNEASRYDDGDVDSAIERLAQGWEDDGMPVSKVVDLLRNDEKFGYYTDEHGNFASHEIIRRTFARMGFDGIVDRTVDVKFGSQRRIGQKMRGMRPSTTHYIAFTPTQIKSAIGNRGTFNPNDPRFTEGAKR